MNNRGRHIFTDDYPTAPIKTEHADAGWPLPRIRITTPTATTPADITELLAAMATVGAAMQRMADQLTEVAASLSMSLSMMAKALEQAGR